MMDVLTQYGMSILIILIMVGVLLYLYKKGKKETVRRIILALVVQAEKKLGSGTGELKYALVVEQLYKILPPILKMLLTEKELDFMIEEAVSLLKAYLVNGKTLLGYDEEQKKLNA